MKCDAMKLHASAQSRGCVGHSQPAAGNAPRDGLRAIYEPVGSTLTRRVRLLDKTHESRIGKFATTSKNRKLRRYLGPER
jgi:hypothetical protein